MPILSLPTVTDPPEAAPPPANYPGDLAMWVFILAELLVFGVFFLGYAAARQAHLAEFTAYQHTLDARFGVFNTVALLTGGYAAAQAVAAIRQDRPRVATRWLLGVCGAGLGFCAVKSVELSAKFAEGVSLSTHLFYTFYLGLSIFHLMHVVLGMVIIGFITVKTVRGGYTATDHAGMETGASYWHMVDLVWVVLFPLLYLVR